RRNFLELTGAAAAIGATQGFAALADDAAANSPAAKPPVQIGSGQWTYTLDEAWGVLPEGMKYGFGCGIAVDGQDRIIVTSRSQHPCVAIFDPQGKLLETWSKDFADKVGFTLEKVA